MSANLSLSPARPRGLTASAARRRIALGLMAASGFAGLGYQIVWTQQSALWLGHESAAVLAVVAAFFGGLAVGALSLGPRIDRSPRPARWYAACEVLIAVWSLALALLLAPASEALLAFTGEQPSAAWQWCVAFAGTFTLLLPATAAMGATLPAMERVLARIGREGGSLAALYACNTAGAVVGVLATSFWLVPEWGLARAAAMCAALNLLCAVGALALSSATPAVPPAKSWPVEMRVLGLLAATGLLGIGYEVLVVRVLSQVSENTVYTFAMLLAVYLVGSALGAAIYACRLARPSDAGTLRDRLLCLQALACLVGTLSVWQAEHVKHFVMQALGPGMAAALASEAVLALAAFLLPTVVMGSLFSHLALQARAAGHGFGRALGVNTLGAALAPLLFGVVLVPALGPKAALLLVAGGYLVLAAPGVVATPLGWSTAGAALALAAWAPPLAFIDVPQGGRVVSYREGAMAAVSVVEDMQGVKRLRIDNRQQEGSSATVFADARQALLPLLLHPAPKRALFLGLGTGITASAAAADPTLQVDAVELLPEVIEASAFFSSASAEAFADPPAIGDSAPRLHVMAADARRFVRTSTQRYDVIVSDNFHPARSGSGSLYTVEHFEAVRGRLAEHGIFCQWLPLHQMDLDTLRSIVQAFVRAYPGGFAMLATNSLDTPVLGLVAAPGAAWIDLSRLRERLAKSTLSQTLGDYGIADEFALLGGFVAGPSSLKRFAGEAPLNTDDRPVVAYRAPRITYAPDTLPRARLVALLDRLALDPAELLGASAGLHESQRLAAYWAARDRFIVAGQSVRPLADPQRMLAQVRQPLLEVLRTSPDFRPAYDPLLRIATALARTDPAGARSLFGELAKLQPARPEAGDALRRLLFASP